MEKTLLEHQLEITLPSLGMNLGSRFDTDELNVMAELEEHTNPFPLTNEGRISRMIYGKPEQAFMEHQNLIERRSSIRSWTRFSLFCYPINTASICIS